MSSGKAVWFLNLNRFLSFYCFIFFLSIGLHKWDSIECGNLSWLWWLRIFNSFQWQYHKLVLSMAGALWWDKCWLSLSLQTGMGTLPHWDTYMRWIAWSIVSLAVRWPVTWLMPLPPLPFPTHIFFYWEPDNLFKAVLQSSNLIQLFYRRKTMKLTGVSGIHH